MENSLGENTQVSRYYGEICLAVAMTALLLYIPANMYPFMKLELYGQVHESTILQGALDLLKSGDVFVALVIILASLIIPFLKIVLLIYLGFKLMRKSALEGTDVKIFHTVELLGRWSMLDVFLVAILVSMVKLGNMAHVSFGLGCFFFLLVVIFSLLASEALTKSLEE